LLLLLLLLLHLLLLLPQLLLLPTLLPTLLVLPLAVLLLLLLLGQLQPPVLHHHPLHHHPDRQQHQQTYSNTECSKSSVSSNTSHELDCWLQPDSVTKSSSICMHKGSEATIRNMQAMLTAPLLQAVLCVQSIRWALAQSAMPVLLPGKHAHITAGI
jgi:hypothetical protein